MRSTRCLPALCIAALALGCSSPAADAGAGDSRSEIVLGSIDSGDPAVVDLWIGDGECTGTLISPHVVLTAQHCVVGTSPSQMQAFFGSDSSQNGTWIDVVDAQAHPSGDIAALALAQPGPAQPIGLSTHAFVNGDENMPVRIAGFGVTSENGEDSGLKRQATTKVSQWDAQFVYLDGFGKDTCYGDSGGPAFIQQNGVEVVAGVTSFGTDTCGNELSGETRVDVFRDWVTGYMSAHDAVAEPSCGADGRCAAGCPSVDPDCPCAADGFCRSLCADPSSDPDCAGCGADGTCHSDCPSPDPDCSPAPGSGAQGNAGTGGTGGKPSRPPTPGSGGANFHVDDSGSSGSCALGRARPRSGRFGLAVFLFGLALVLRARRDRELS